MARCATLRGVMATDDLKRLVAREIAHGECIADVARRHGYSWKGMHKLVRSPDVQRLIAEEREALEDLAEQYRAQLVMGGATALDNVRRVVEDPDHPRCLDTSRWLLDKVLPRRNDTPTVAIAMQAVDAQVLANVAGMLREGDERRAASGTVPSYEKYVLTGTEGIETGED